MIETDAPFLTPRNLPNKPFDNRNEPSFLPHVAKEVAKYIGISEEELVKRTYENTMKFFKLENK